jgi:AhpD family alkylhydroperoxidase
MSWTAKEKELVAVGISVAAGCRPCTSHHLKAVRRTGAGEEEIRDAIASAVSIRRKAGDSIGRYALGRRADGLEGDPGEGEFVRIAALLAVGAAYVVNCTEALDEHLIAAREGGIGEAELRELLELAVAIKGAADQHVRKLARIEDADAESPSHGPSAAA